MVIESNDIINELKSIKEDLSYIKEHMVDIDSIMTQDDYRAIEEARKDKKNNKLISEDQLKKELGL